MATVLEWQMSVSVRTVEAHLRNIFGKLGVRSRTEAALWAISSSTGWTFPGVPLMMRNISLVAADSRAWRWASS